MDINAIGIGYEGLDAAGLLSRLKLRGVSTVVDVRLNPISRKRGMSKNALRELLSAAGIGYEHLSVLGNPQDNREGFSDAEGQLGRSARKRFQEILNTPEAQRGLHHVAALAESGVVALLCFEADENACHRQVVLSALKDHEFIPA